MTRDIIGKSTDELIPLPMTPVNQIVDNRMSSQDPGNISLLNAKPPLAYQGQYR